jgi:DNA polymerase III subunit gamma/tau
MTFGDVLGQEGAVLLLKARLAKDTALDTNYVFSGGHGQGKTTLARILARAMLCMNLNKANPEPCNECENCRDVLAETSGAYVEQDAASRGTIEHVRAIVDDLPFAVFNAPKRVYVFDEAHRMSKDAQDVLLKPLEDKKMVGIFCTTEPEKIRGPIRSRCEEYAIRKITREDVLVRMKKILNAEEVYHEDDAVLTVIDYSGGHVRDVVNRLEMIAQAGDVTLKSVREYLHLNVVATYYEILLALGDSKRAISLIEQAIERVSAEEVSAGLAEAAMNSFRLANGMFAEFVYVDRALGQQLWERYGVGCIKLAEYFLRTRYATKVSLICDVLNLAGGIPSPQASSVIIQVAGPMSPPAQTIVSGPPSEAVVTSEPAGPMVSGPAPTEGVTTAPGGTSTGPVVQTAPVASAPATPPVVTAAPVQPPKPVGRGLRPDGIGSLGSSDVEALTELDHKTVPLEKARGRSNQPTQVIFTSDPNQDADLRVLMPDEWRREFERTWPGRG